MAMYILQQIMAILPGIGKTQINRRNEPWRQGETPVAVVYYIFIYVLLLQPVSVGNMMDGEMR